MIHLLNCMVDPAKVSMIKCSYSDGTFYVDLTCDGVLNRLCYIKMKLTKNGDFYYCLPKNGVYDTEAICNFIETLITKRVQNKTYLYYSEFEKELKINKYTIEREYIYDGESKGIISLQLFKC